MCAQDSIGEGKIYEKEIIKDIVGQEQYTPIKN